MCGWGGGWAEERRIPDVISSPLPMVLFFSPGPLLSFKPAPLPPDFSLSPPPSKRREMENRLLFALGRKTNFRKVLNFPFPHSFFPFSPKKRSTCTPTFPALITRCSQAGPGDAREERRRKVHHPHQHRTLFLHLLLRGSPAFLLLCPSSFFSFRAFLRFHIAREYTS